MGDLQNLIETLEARLPAIRRELGDDWAAFTKLLAEAAPYFEQAEADPDARLEAIYRLKHACIQFPATRRVLPAPGGMIPEPKPEPAAGQTTTGLPKDPMAQKEPDVAGLMERAARLCRSADAVADERERQSAGRQE